MPVVSNWKLTFDPAGTPLVFLNIGDKMDDELKWRMRKGLEIVELTDSDNPFLRPTRNVSVSLVFSVMTDESLDSTARQRVMESLIAVGALGKKPLRIEVSGITDRYWQFANCCAADHEPFRLLKSPKARISKMYALTCTGLTQTIIP